MLVSAALLIALLGSASAECPNACSAHGKCGAYDMCTCYRNWMSNDCSERVCQFGLAHVDTPKGDLDASSGALTGPGNLVGVGSTVYPAGTTEQFPNMQDSAQRVLTDTAHYYMECSNKGLCDRTSGQCTCFEGYSGSACQRASCPDTGSGVCSGHGTCENIKTLAHWDHENIYKLWDEQATMGCSCDGGWTGADCSQKQCKFGADPLYQDSFQTIRYSNWTYSIVTGTANNPTVIGNYSLVLSDATGERWQTGPIDIAATCAQVIAQLEKIPNDVIPGGTVQCRKWSNEYLYGETTRFEPTDISSFAKTHVKYTLAFPGNPGADMKLNINHRLDGNRPTLYTEEATSTLKWYIYQNGFYGETHDYAPDLCEGVIASVNHVNNGFEEYDFLDGLDTVEMDLLKRCLGDADGISTNQADEVYNWDYGTRFNPHLIKLVDATQDNKQYADADPTHEIPNKFSVTYLCNPNAPLAITTNTPPAGSNCVQMNPPGFYAAVYYNRTIQLNGIVGRFRLMSRPSTDYSIQSPFHIYTSKGHLNLVSDTTVAFNTWGNPDYPAQIYTDYVLSDSLFTWNRDGQTRMGLDCETASAGQECLQKGDLMMVMNNGMPYRIIVDTAFPPLDNNKYKSNPVYPQIYTVEKISREPIPYANYAASLSANPNAGLGTYPSFIRNQIKLDKPLNARYHWEAPTNNHFRDTSAAVYKFYPPANAYEYAGECSMRGICDRSTGTCGCFGGFTGDNCQRIDALAA